jgi:4-amino-4-deoxy-L-arabinose transferase-like glycosyltransferase
MLLKLSSIAALICVLIARALGPSDLWDQTQPKTVSYTTDILVHGGDRWILPIERGTLPATKPPLYNWMAAPLVRLCGFESEIAHKFPSIAALCLCWLIVVRLGRWLDQDGDGSVGWLAGLAFVSNYTIFKLGFLARPDMLLTLWLLLAWITSTAVIAGRTLAVSRGMANAACAMPRTASIIAFWTCMALAGLTKGPPALVAVIYALVAARFIGGSWRSFNALRWWWGLPAVLLINGAWVLGVWRINPEHVRTVLWGEEVFGRITGAGPEGGGEGFIGWLTTLFNLAIYFLVRFLPWSIPAIAMMWSLRRCGLKPRMNTDEHGCGHSLTTSSSSFSSSSIRVHPCSSAVPLFWLRSAAIFVIVVIGVFTLSAGKRADYIAAAFAPGSLLAAWWLLRMKPALGLRAPWLAPTLAGLTLAAMTWVNHRLPLAPSHGFGDEIERFVVAAAQAMAKEPLPVITCWTGETHMQAMLGLSQKDDSDAALDLARSGEVFWLLAGPRFAEPHDAGEWIERRRRVRAVAVLRSSELPRDRGWPGTVALFRIEPVRQ